MSDLTVTLGQAAAGGGFVARDETGRVLFVRHGLPGERVIAHITEEHPTWARADAIEILEASEHRVTPPCVFSGAGKCGGCDYQHVDHAYQSTLKQQLLTEQLRKIAKINLHVEIERVPSSPPGLGTRTRVRFGVNEEGHIGMRRHRSHDIIPVTTCLLGVTEIQEAELDELSWPPGSDVQVLSLGADSTPSITLLERHEEGSEDDDLDPFEDEAFEHRTEVLGLSYQISSDSFWQINVNAPKVLVEAVLSGMEPSKGDKVLDLYCGVGLFTKAIAQMIGETGTVVGIDSSASSIKDARANLEEFPWAVTRHAPVNKHTIADTLAGFNALVLDPPRNGCDKGALKEIAASESLQTIVSVSCDPATFARDTKILLEHGWMLTSLRAFDLFEMTERVECVAVFRR